jgi:hypothetical protein
MIPQIGFYADGKSRYSGAEPACLAGLVVSNAMTELYDELASGIAQALNERGKHQVAQIRRLIECLGPKAVLTYAEKAKAIDKQAAILTCRGHRFRTVGGIFYLLAKDDPNLTPETRLYCYRFERYATKEKAPGTSEAFPQSIERSTGATAERLNIPIVAHALRSVNMTAERRYNANPHPQP